MDSPNDKKYIKNHNGTNSFFLYEEFRGVTDLTIIIPMLKETDFPFFIRDWYLSLDYSSNRLPFQYLAKMKLCSFKSYTFKDSVEMNSRIKKDDNNYKYVIRLKDELKDHKELLELIYREEEVKPNGTY